MRRQLKKAGWDFEAGRITTPRGFGDMYRRQVLKGTNGPRARTTGEITLDYDFTTSVDGVNYCYQRSLAKYSRTTKWKVQRSLAYFGPGAPEGQDPADF